MKSPIESYKKSLAVLLLAFLAMATFSACSSDSEEAPPPPPAEEESAPPPEEDREACERMDTPEAKEECYQELDTEF